MNKTYLLMHGKREDVTKRMPDNSVDLVFEDPPFGVRKQEEWDDKDLFIKSVESWLLEGLRITKSTLIWFCASRMMPYIFKVINGKEDMFLRMHVWDKPPGTQFAGSSHNNIWYSIEPILVFTKNKEVTTKYGKTAQYSYDTFSFPTVAGKEYDHPTSKPLGLIKRLISHYSEPKDVVFDGFMGSGTTGVACVMFDRRFIGVEQLPITNKTVTTRDGDNPNHFFNAENRIRATEIEPTFFNLEPEEIGQVQTLFGG